jgi:hypothetical protein
MAKKFNAQVGDLVVFNHNLDAAVFRVAEVGPGFRLGVTDHSMEAMGVQASIQTTDKSLALPLSVGQLAQIK